jgi:hypothetical protein
MTVSSPMSAQAKGELPAVPAAIQMPKAMIPIEIRNENAAFMLTSIPKRAFSLKAAYTSGKIEADGCLARQSLARKMWIDLWGTLAIGQRKTARRRSVLRGVTLSWQD